MTVYLDMNATTPVDERVFKAMKPYFMIEYGNAGSRTHEYGARAAQAVQRARRQVASVAYCEPDEVIFTSGATEANNIAILGLSDFGNASERRHIVSSSIEHKAVLEPLEEMERRGFEVTLVGPDHGGRVDLSALESAMRPDTLLVSVMHANNETGVVQPITEIADLLTDHDALFHVDSAQTFGKQTAPSKEPRVDMISVSGHKIYGPKGVGALITRKRGRQRPALKPLMFGGGQERGLRPGTLAVPLIVGLGEAAKHGAENFTERAARCLGIRQQVLSEFARLDAVINGELEHTMPHVINLSIPDADAEAIMVALKGHAAISNGSACTSASYEPSHVLTAMQLSRDRIDNALRISWSHDTRDINIDEVVNVICDLR